MPPRSRGPLQKTGNICLRLPAWFIFDIGEALYDGGESRRHPHVFEPRPTFQCLHTLCHEGLLVKPGCRKSGAPDPSPAGFSASEDSDVQFVGDLEDICGRFGGYLRERCLTSPAIAVNYKASAKQGPSGIHICAAFTHPGTAINGICPPCRAAAFHSSSVNWNQDCLAGYNI